MNWTPWRQLAPRTPFTTVSLQETLDGGQAFRWNYNAAKKRWEGIWSRHYVRLRLHHSDGLLFSCPEESMTNLPEELKEYLLLDEDWTERSHQLPWRSDAHLKLTFDHFPGLRILNQPFAETLLCFMCSATKQIPQIKILCERLAYTFGDELYPQGPHALPTWSQIHAVEEADLRAIGLGFRARNIKKTADLIVQNPEILQKIEALPYAEARTHLVRFPGVGSKIADCSLLFGAQKYEAFPVDTWIIKTLETRYGLTGWNKSQLEQFGRIHLGSYAGLAQQFLFAYERASRKPLDPAILAAPRSPKTLESEH